MSGGRWASSGSPRKAGAGPARVLEVSRWRQGAQREKEEEPEGGRRRGESQKRQSENDK